MAKDRGSKTLNEMAAALRRRKQQNDRAQRERRKARGEALVPANDTGQLVNDFAAAHGDYERHGRHVVNRGGSVIDRWMKQGGVGFEEPQRHAILHCQMLWSRLGTVGRLTANYGGVGGVRADQWNGWSHEDAFAQLAQYHGDIPAGYWLVFERICRDDWSAGDAGAALNQRHPSQRAAAAKAAVGFVASLIAQWRGF